MNFLNPFFLLGLLAVAVPVVIHFINLHRPQKIAFSSLTFLNKLKEDAIRRIRIKEYLLLALRILAVTMLALALARPFIPPTLVGGSGSAQSRGIALLIDNSSSTARIAQGGPLIDQAKDIVLGIVDEASAADRFIVGTTNGEGKESKLIGREEARKAVQDIEPVNAGNYTARNYSHLRESIRQAGFSSTEMYLITDGQQTQFKKLENISVTENETPFYVHFIKLQQSSQQNTAVDDITLQNQIISRASPVTLKVNIKNTGETPAVNQFVSLSTGGRMAGQYAVNLEPGQSKEFLFEVTPEQPGDWIGQVTVEGDEVSFDNTRHFVVHIPPTQSVLLISDPDRSATFQSYLEPALQAAAIANGQLSLAVKSPGQVNSSDFSGFDTIILDGLQQVPGYWVKELQQQVQNGKGLLFFPSEQGDIVNYNQFLNNLRMGSYGGVQGTYGSFDPVTKVEHLLPGHPVLDGLFKTKKDEPIRVNRPELFFFYTYQPLEEIFSQTILKTETGDPLLTEHRLGDGKILVSSIGTDPGWSNFPVKPLFAPLFYRSVLYAASGEQGRLKQHVLGHGFEWEAGTTARSVTLRLNNEEIKPDVTIDAEGARVLYPGREWMPGILQVITDKGQHAVAVNQDIMESDFGTLTEGELENLFQNSVTTVHMINADNHSVADIKRKLKTANFGKEIWNWFLWMAFVLLIVETAVSKFYKAEKIS